MIKLLVAVAIIVARTWALQGTFIDMREGIPQGVEPRCDGNFRNAWKEDLAANHFLQEDGKIAVSENEKNSCMWTVMDVQRDYKLLFRYYIAPKDGQSIPNTAILRFYFVDKTSLQLKATKNIMGNDTRNGWNIMSSDLPPEFTSIFQPQEYRVEIVAFDRVKYVAIQWFGISNEELPPPTTTTTTMIPTTITPSTTPATTSGEVTSKSDTTPTVPTEQSTSELTATTEEPTEPTLTTAQTISTEISPPQLTTNKDDNPITQPTPKPPPQTVSVFPELWSTLLGVAIGIIAMCLIFFVVTCCRQCLFGKRTARSQTTNDNFKLPRLEVVSNSSQKSITGSFNSSAGTADPFWVKSKAWSHVP